MSRPAGAEAQRSTCRCGAQVLRQLVGRRAALSVTADATPLPLAQALALTEPNRLAWCLRQTKNGPDLRWLYPQTHRDDCPHQHVVDHQCTPRAPKPARNF